MRKTLHASILVLVLFGSARAGDIPSTPVAPPPPPPAASGEIHTDAAEPEDALKGIVLSLLQSVLSLF